MLRFPGGPNHHALFLLRDPGNGLLARDAQAEVVARLAVHMPRKRADPRVIDPAWALGLPIRDLLLVHLKARDEILLEAAMVRVSNALGNRTDLLYNDRNYYDFVFNYVTEVLVPYVLRVASPQLGMLAAFSGDSTSRLFEVFTPELAKVSEQLIPDHDAATLILREPSRRAQFFLAVLALTALLCKRDPDSARVRLFGLKRGLVGSWKKVRDERFEQFG